MQRQATTPVAASESLPERLQTSLDEFADNVRVLTDIVDQLREDVSRLMRNGMPHQPLTVLIHRMPLVEADRSERGSFECSLLSSTARDPTADTLLDAGHDSSKECRMTDERTGWPGDLHDRRVGRNRCSPGRRTNGGQEEVCRFAQPSQRVCAPAD